MSRSTHLKMSALCIRGIIPFVLTVAALKIHVSPSTREVLELFNCFELEYRGEMEMKVIWDMTHQ